MDRTDTAGEFVASRPDRSPKRYDAGFPADAGEICSVLDFDDACMFPLPASWKLGRVDFAKVVVLVENVGTPEWTVGHVDDIDACDAIAGWHYNNPESPTHILLCERACGFLNEDPDRGIQLILGCDAVCGFEDAGCEMPDLPPLL